MSDAGPADLQVIRPSVAILKEVSPSGTPPPGTDLTFTITVTN